MICKHQVIICQTSVASDHPHGSVPLNVVRVEEEEEKEKEGWSLADGVKSHGCVFT